MKKLEGQWRTCDGHLFDKLQNAIEHELKQDLESNLLPYLHYDTFNTEGIIEDIHDPETPISKFVALLIKHRKENK